MKKLLLLTLLLTSHLVNAQVVIPSEDTTNLILSGGNGWLTLQDLHPYAEYPDTIIWDSAYYYPAKIIYEGKLLAHSYRNGEHSSTFTTDGNQFLLVSFLLQKLTEAYADLKDCKQK